MTVASSTSSTTFYTATSTSCQCPGFNGKYHKCWHSSKAAYIENGGARNVTEARARRIARNKQIAKENRDCYMRMQYQVA